MKQYTILFIAALLLITFQNSCSSKPADNTQNTDTADNLQVITKEQFKANHMAIGHTTLQSFEEIVSCNGIITATPGGQAQVASPLPGTITAVTSNLGQTVQKGQVLCRLTSNEFIQLQSRFVEAATQLKQLKADYDRKQTLYQEAIGSEKDFLALESQYHTARANHQALKLQLELLNLSVTPIERGEFYASYPLIAPISGTITRHEAALGQYVDPHHCLVEVLDPTQMQLQLAVFQKDRHQLKVGQTVRFQSTDAADTTHWATLTAVGKALMPDTKTITCLAAIKSDNTDGLLLESFIQAQIIISETQAQALPHEAIIKTEEGYFVQAIAKSDDKAYYLQSQKVQIGATSGSHTEVINSAALDQVLIQGVYHLGVE